MDQSWLVFLMCLVCFGTCHAGELKTKLFACFFLYFVVEANYIFFSYCNTAQKKTVTTMLTYTWKCTVLHCNHPGNTWKPLGLMTGHFDYCPSTSEGDNQSLRSSAPVVSRCFLGGYSVKLYISRGRLAWWLLAFLHSVMWCYAQIVMKVTFNGTVISQTAYISCSAKHNWKVSCCLKYVNTGRTSLK